jgi:hypothetical protein
MTKKQRIAWKRATKIPSTLADQILRRVDRLIPMHQERALQELERAVLGHLGRWPLDLQGASDGIAQWDPSCSNAS